MDNENSVINYSLSSRWKVRGSLAVHQTILQQNSIDLNNLSWRRLVLKCKEPTEHQKHNPEVLDHAKLVVWSYLMVVFGQLFAFEDKSPSTAVETFPDFSFCFQFDPIISCFCSPNTAAHTKHLLLLLRHIKRWLSLWSPVCHPG